MEVVCDDKDNWTSSEGRRLEQSELPDNENSGRPVLIRMWVLIKQKMSDLASYPSSLWGSLTSRGGLSPKSRSTDSEPLFLLFISIKSSMVVLAFI